MAASEQKDSGAERTNSEIFQNVPCPFCGVLCDDLEIARTGQDLKIRKNGCTRSSAGFERPLTDAKPQIDGKDVSFDEAVAAAAGLIRASALPLYGGLATDVEGIRAAMSIADRSGGVVDHALSEAQYRNFRVLQTSGWVMSTLTETRNRADLIVIVSTDVHTLHPRFFDRIVCPEETIFDDPPLKRTVVFLGKGLDTSGAVGPRIKEVITLPCENAQVAEVLEAVRVMNRGVAISAESIAGISRADVERLAGLCKAASYGVMVWAPPGLNFPHADLTVHAISELVKELNVTTRFAGLSLGGNEGAVSAAAVCGWQSGYPLRVSFASGKPEYNPQNYAIGRMLADGEGDLLVWIASISPDIVPPANKLPTIVLGTPGLKITGTPKIYIPVGTPGIDHAGRMVRCDNVVSLPLRNLKRSNLPRVADVLTAIEAAL